MSEHVRVARFLGDDGEILEGVVEGDELEEISGLDSMLEGGRRLARKRKLSEVKLLPFGTFCPIGPWVTVGLDWSDLRVVCRVNGQVKQDGRSSDQIFPVPKLLAFISEGMTLEPGDVVTTGTPEGVGPIRAGDTVEIEVEGVGVLRNPVVER